MSAPLVAQQLDCNNLDSCLREEILQKPAKLYKKRFNAYEAQLIIAFVACFPFKWGRNLPVVNIIIMRSLATTR